MTADALLAAIIAAPADDVPRLVYADFADEHGDPARAEFIRLQVGLANGTVTDPAATVRADNLLRANRKQWKLQGVRGVQEFHRGFVGGVRMTGEQFVRAADRLDREAPVTAVRLSVVLEHLDAIAAVEWLPRIDTFDLSGNSRLASWLGDFFERADFPNLRSLILRDIPLWPYAVGTVAGVVGRLPALVALELSGNPLGDDGLIELIEYPTLRRVQEFVFRCDGRTFEESLHARGTAALADSAFLLGLRSLTLSGHAIGDAGLIAMAGSANAGGLEHLDVSDNDIGEAGDRWAEAVAASPHLRRLKQLGLRRTRVGVLAADELARWPHLATGCVIDLRESEMPWPARKTLLRSRWADQILLSEPDDEATV